MKSFAAGAATAWGALKAAQALAVSDTKVGREVRKNILGRLDMDRLLRLEQEVGEEINRRVRQQERRK